MSDVGAVDYTLINNLEASLLGQPPGAFELLRIDSFKFPPRWAKISSECPTISVGLSKVSY